MDIPCYNETTILGIHITSTIQASSLRSWTLTTAKVRAHAREAYYREQSLDQRTHYVHNHLVDRVWYLAQIYPPAEVCVSEINSTIAWFSWRGDIPLATLETATEKGRRRLGTQTLNCDQAKVLTVPLSVMHSCVSSQWWDQ
jgi:hypothetical protein